MTEPEVWGLCFYCSRKLFKAAAGSYGTIEIKCPKCNGITAFRLVTSDGGKFQVVRAAKNP